MGKVRVVLAGIFLLIYVLNNLGCAAAWFLAGAGTAATVIAVTDKEEKAKSTDTKTKK